MKKYPYFPPEDGIGRQTDDLRKQMKIIAQRYIGANPPLPYTARVVSGESFRQTSNGTWQVNLASKLGEGTDGYALTACLIRSDFAKTVELTLACMGPTTAWLNGETIYQSDFRDGIHVKLPHPLQVDICAGDNLLLFLCRRTKAGFGFELQTPNVPVLCPLHSRRGMAGWVWTPCMDVPPQEPAEWFESQKKNGDEGWYPRVKRADTAAAPQMALFPNLRDTCTAWCKVEHALGREVRLEIDSLGKNDVFCNGQLVLSCEKGQHTVSLPAAEQMNLHVVSYAGDAYGAQVSVSGARLALPVQVQGAADAWLYTEGTRLANSLEDLYCAEYRVLGEQLYVRLFYEGAFGDIWWVRQGGTAFGSWNYPVGVTLQGLLRCGDLLGDKDIAGYVQAHMAQCMAAYEYSCADCERHGYPSINPYLVRQHSLDDFGSMGSAMLECYRHVPFDMGKRLADGFYAHIRDDLPRMPNGALYRLKGSARELDTIWADDLYMGTSFLKRYGELFHCAEAFDLAAKQFIAYSEYLMMPDAHVLSHVFDVTRGMATGVPWGRGNGWALYSLAELLEALPAGHPDYAALKELYCQFAAGVVNLQDAKGCWHQVLTDDSSYEEASCTAMFTYAISKGLRKGWLDMPEKYMDCVHRGWQAISNAFVDKFGNVHAVCKGSSFSFTKEYYRDELFWIVNDNHGVGIVLLAATEYLKLLEGR